MMDGDPPTQGGKTAAPLEYATSPADDRALRRLVVLNAVCGPLAMAEVALLFAGAFLYVWYVVAGHRTAPGVGDFESAFHMHPSELWATSAYPIAGGAAAVVSAAAIGRRRWRAFSIVAAFVMCFIALPVGTIAGIPTAVVLMRPSSAAAYAAHRRTRFGTRSG